MSEPLDDLDRALILATQEGLPLVAEPYHAVAEKIGTTPEDVMARLERMRAKKILRRIGAVPNHYRLGYVANGMSVWIVDETRVAEAGRKVAALPFVSHCYRRPRGPNWPYTLFAMVHGKDHAEVMAQVEQIAAELGDWNQGHKVLFSKRILKKTGLRLAA